MRKFYLLIIIIELFAVQNMIGQAKLKTKNECLNCHRENDILPDDFNQNDVHLKIGLTCADCHGGDPTSTDEDTAMSESNGFVGAPDKSETPKFCGKCHSNINFMRKYNPRMETDQVKQYYTSVHGIQLKKGNEDVAVCTNCHTAHSIFGAKDPRSSVYALNVPETCQKCHGDSELMSKYNLPSDVYEKFSKSVHGIALLKDRDTGAPACNDCHGNHGAVPPGVNSISYVCGECHVNNMNLFKASLMGKAFVENEFHGCVECHNNHLVLKPTDDFVGVGENAVCIDCHDSGDKGYETADKIHKDITNLAAKYTDVEEHLEEVKAKGMNDEEIEFLMKDIKQNLIESRTAVHSFDAQKVEEKTAAGGVLADSAITLANAEFSEYNFRRNGLGLATLIFAILGVGIYFKIKKLDNNTENQ